MIELTKIRTDGGTQVDFPISEFSLRASSWRGLAFNNTGVVIATITGSDLEPSKFMVRVCGRSASQCIRPVAADEVGMMLLSLADAHGVTVNEFKWSEADDIPLDAPEESAAIAGGAIVYFLRAGPFVKIGKATGSPLGRIAALQTGCPYKIELIGTAPGSYGLEHSLHREFESDRAYGEWFKFSDALGARIFSILQEQGE